MADDADHQRLDVYGRAEPVGVKVHEVLNTAPKSYLIEKNIEKKESIYLSHKREPLGKPYVRGHELPTPFAQGQVGFGRPTPQDVMGTLQQLSKMQEESRRGGDRNPETGSSGGGYACTNCGATLQGEAEVSPSGDVKCSYCERWFNIHRSA